MLQRKMPPEYYCHYYWCRLLDRVLKSAKEDKIADMQYYMLLMDEEKKKPDYENYKKEKTNAKR